MLGSGMPPRKVHCPVLHEDVDSIRERTGESVDALFREMFRSQAW